MMGADRTQVVDTASARTSALDFQVRELNTSSPQSQELYKDSPSQNHSSYCNSFLSIGQTERLRAIKDELVYFFVPIWSR